MLADTRWYSGTNDRPTAKKELAIDLDDVDDDNTLDEYGHAANRKIDNKLFPFKDSVPISDQDVTAELKSAAILYVVYRYKLKTKSFDAAKEYKTEFVDLIDDVIERYKAKPEGRTDWVVETNEYRSEPLRSRERFFG